MTDIPLGTWTEFERTAANNPIIQASGSGFDADGAAATHHIVDGSTLHYLWAGYNASTSPPKWEIARSYADVSTPFSLTRSTANPILSPGASGTWDEAGVEYPSPFFNSADSTYYMYYTGDDSNNIRQIGLATRGADWDSWSKSASNPVISPSGTGYRSHEVGWQDATEVDGTIHIVYTSDSTSGDGGKALAHATAPATDPTNITQDPNNPILTGSDVAWATGELREPGITHTSDGYFQVFYSGENPDWQSGHFRISDSLTDWAPSDIEQNPANPIWASSDINSYDTPDHLTPVVREVDGQYVMVFAAGTATPYVTGAATAPLPSERNSLSWSQTQTWADEQSSTFIEHESTESDLTLGYAHDFENGVLERITSVSGTVGVGGLSDSKQGEMSMYLTDGSALSGSNYAVARFDTDGPHTGQGRIEGWCKVEQNGESNGSPGFVARDTSAGTYVRGVFDPASSTNPKLFDESNNALDSGGASASWDTYYWVSFIPDAPNDSYTVEMRDSPGGTLLGSASASYTGITDYVLETLAFQLSRTFVDRVSARVEGVRGSWRGGGRVLSSTKDASALTVTTENVTPNGQTARARLHSDPDGDGTFEETSDWFTLDGTTQDVTGLSTNSARFELEVELETADASSIPSVQTLEVSDSSGGGSSSGSVIATTSGTINTS